VYFYLKSLAKGLILPPGFPLILTLIGAFLIWRHRRVGWVIFVLGFASLWLLCTPIVADGLTLLAQRCPPLDPTQPVNAQAVVILGGGPERHYAPEYDGPIVEGILLERVTLGAYLAQHYSLPVVISGSESEAYTMAGTLKRNFGITPRWVEGRSRDTFENARFSAKILFPAGVTRIVLVTSNTHEYRATQEFLAAGFEVTSAPVSVYGNREVEIFRYIPSPAGLDRSNLAIYELIGEPMRRLQAALGVREKLDGGLRRAAPVVPPVSTPESAASPTSQTGSN
jgi:uncharacterized SAM-binding protein YcdF (DUF218 family)